MDMATVEGLSSHLLDRLKIALQHSGRAYSAALPLSGASTESAFCGMARWLRMMHTDAMDQADRAESSSKRNEGRGLAGGLVGEVCDLEVVQL